MPLNMSSGNQTQTDWHFKMFLSISALIYIIGSLANCFSPYLVNVERMESCSVCLDMAFISEEFCMIIFMVTHG